MGFIRLKLLHNTGKELKGFLGYLIHSGELFLGVGVGRPLTHSSQKILGKSYYILFVARGGYREEKL